MDELMFMNMDAEIAADYGYCPTGIIEYKSFPVDDKGKLVDPNDTQKSTALTTGEICEKWKTRNAKTNSNWRNKV